MVNSLARHKHCDVDKVAFGLGGYSQKKKIYTKRQPKPITKPTRLIELVLIRVNSWSIKKPSVNPCLIFLRVFYAFLSSSHEGRETSHGPHIFALFRTFHTIFRIFSNVFKRFCSFLHVFPRFLHIFALPIPPNHCDLTPPPSFLTKKQRSHRCICTDGFTIIELPHIIIFSSWLIFSS